MNNSDTAISIDDIRRIIAEEVKRITSNQPAAPSEREVLSADHVAEFLGIDRNTVYEYANRGRLPHRRLGRRLLFSRSALIVWLGHASERRAGKE